MNNLREYRLKKGLNQRELDELIGLTDAAISLAEHSKLPVKTAKQLSPILNANVFELLGTDALRILPKTEEERQSLIAAINDLQVECSKEDKIKKQVDDLIEDLMNEASTEYREDVIEPAILNIVDWYYKKTITQEEFEMMMNYLKCDYGIEELNKSQSDWEL